MLINELCKPLCEERFCPNLPVKRTVNALAIPLRLAIEQRVLVLGQHLSLRRHLRLPILQCRNGLPLLRQRRVQRRDDIVDGPETLSVPPLLELGQTPGDFPEETP